MGAVAWYYDNAGGHTHPVGVKRPNELGLHDMSGNVSEWVQDCGYDNYRDAPNDGSAWEAGNCSMRMERGGSFLSNYLPIELRNAERFWRSADARSGSRGFRIARTLTR